MKEKHLIRIILSVAMLIIIGIVAWWMRPESEPQTQSTVMNTQMNSDSAKGGDSVNANLSEAEAKVDEKYLIEENGIEGLHLNDDMKSVVKNLQHIYKVEKHRNGPDVTDYIYIIKENGKAKFSLIENSEGKVNDIFIFDPQYETKEGIRVGTPYKEIFAKYSNYDMRFGDVYEGVNDIYSGELLKLNGKLFVHYVEENSDKMMATYNYDNQTFKLKSKTPKATVNSILLTLSMW